MGVQCGWAVRTPLTFPYQDINNLVMWEWPGLHTAENSALSCFWDTGSLLRDYRGDCGIADTVLTSEEKKYDKKLHGRIHCRRSDNSPKIPSWPKGSLWTEDQTHSINTVEEWCGLVNFCAEGENFIHFDLWLIHLTVLKRERQKWNVEAKTLYIHGEFEKTNSFSKQI